MKTRHLALAAAPLALLALTACDGNDTTYAVQPAPAINTVQMWCVAPMPDGTQQLVDDDYCEDSPQAFIYWYGGSTYHSGSHTYVRGGGSHRPYGSPVKVRPPANGGSHRTQGKALSYNNTVRDQQAAKQYRTPSSGYGDDRRQPKSGWQKFKDSFKSGGSSKSGTSSRSGGRR